MARITRKELKSDKFALEVEHTFTYFEEHRQDILRYSVAAAVVVAIVLAVAAYMRHQHAVREVALAQAIRVQEAPVGLPGPGAPPLIFPSQEAKDKEAVRAFSEVQSKYSSSDEGIIAEYYLGSISTDQGKVADAEKRFQHVAKDGNAKYASLAKLSLAQIYFADGRADQGEKLLRELIERPTVFVSKEHATIALARQLARTKPAEARKLLDPLRSARGPVSQIALTLYSELPQQ